MHWKLKLGWWVFHRVDKVLNWCGLKHITALHYQKGFTRGRIVLLQELKKEDWYKELRNKAREDYLPLLRQAKERITLLERENKALKKRYVTTFSQKIRGEVFGKAKWRCEYCGSKPKSLTIDHIKPIVKGGTSDISNLAAACFSCNKRKGNKDVEVFIKELANTD